LNENQLKRIECPIATEERTPRLTPHEQYPPNCRRWWLASITI
jgi:hypothetical protein